MSNMKFKDFAHDAKPQHFKGEYRDTDQVRLLVVDATRNSITQDWFANLGAYLRDDDLLAINDVGIARSRLRGHFTNGRAPVDVCFLMLANPSEDSTTWEAVILGETPPKSRGHITLCDGRIKGTILTKTQDFDGSYWIARDKYSGYRGLLRIENSVDDLHLALESNGLFMHPWYTDLNQLTNEQLYPTPTGRNAGIHASEPARRITPQMYHDLYARGIQKLSFSLSMSFSWQQFSPETKLTDYRMNAEDFSLSAVAISQLGQAVASRRRVVCIGTSAARALETLPLPPAPVTARTNIFIAPGHTFKYCNALLTNLHNPMGTHVIMACAFGDRGLVLEACNIAARENYRFGINGDAMLIFGAHTPSAWRSQYEEHGVRQ
jgi:S-adenosylmethionine:tRNA ribosyltransferase-isomerase